MHKDQQFIQNQAHNQLEELGFAFLFGGGGLFVCFCQAFYGALLEWKVGKVLKSLV